MAVLAGITSHLLRQLANFHLVALLDSIDVAHLDAVVDVVEIVVVAAAAAVEEDAASAGHVVVVVPGLLRSARPGHFPGLLARARQHQVLRLDRPVVHRSRDQSGTGQIKLNGSAFMNPRTKSIAIQ